MAPSKRVNLSVGKDWPSEQCRISSVWHGCAPPLVTELSENIRRNIITNHLIHKMFDFKPEN